MGEGSAIRQDRSVNKQFAESLIAKSALFLGAPCPALSPFSPSQPRHEPVTTPKTSAQAVPISPNQPENHAENARKAQKPYGKPP